MKQTKILFSFGILLLAAISCTSDEYISSAKIGTGVSFDVSVAQLQEQQGESFKAPAITNTPMKGKGTQMYLRQTTVGTIDQHMEADFKTRGTKVNAINNFKLYSYKYSGSWSSSFSTATQVSNGVILESGNNWKLTTPWADTSMAFFGIYDETNSASFSTNSGGELTYTVPTAVADQKDLLVAKNVDITEATNDSKVPMTFSHALTAVQFGIGSVMAPGTITKVELQGIKNSGIYRYTNNTWTASSTTTTYTISNLNVDIASNKGSGGTKLFTGNNNDLLLLMPQTLGSEAKLVVYITENGTSQTLSVSLTGEWKAGHTVTYSLTTNSETGQYVFIVGDLDKSSIDENGGTVSSTVKSYYQDYYGTQTAVGWTATYSVDGGAETSAVGDVVSSFTANGTGCSDCSMTVEKSYPISDPSLNSHTQTLRNAAIQGTDSNPINLAGSRETTANCYIVSAPGYYKLPLVYGNGLKNGTNNSASLVGGTFVNHAGTAITTPYIKDYATPDNAVIVWQDAYHLVHPSSLQISSDNNFLSFQVPQQYICQGNCVLAVRDASNTILWSWHIWVTDYNINETVEIINRSNTHYHFMPIPFGFCDEDERKAKRKIILKVQQAHSNMEISKELTQSSSSSSFSLGVNAVYFQWGRKDPMCPSNGIADADKTLYDNTYSFEIQNSLTSMNNTIKYPYRFFYMQDSNWSDITQTNWWDVSNTTENSYSYDEQSHKVIKSIYDPNPVGYKMPAPLAFSRFILGDKVYTYQESEINAENTDTYSTDKGYYLYVQNDKTGKTDFWHALGIRDVWTVRDAHGNLEAVGLHGVYWNSGCFYNGRYGGNMYFFNSDFTSDRYLCTSYGFNIRPVKDE